MSEQIAETQQCFDLGVVAAGTQYGRPVFCNKRNARYATFGFELVVTAATLQAALDFLTGMNPAPAEQVQAALVAGNVLSTLPTGITVSSNTLAIANPAIGTYRGVLRFVDPLPYLTPRYVFTSGGGTVVLKMKAVY